MTNLTADVVVVNRDDSVVGSGSVSPLASLLDVTEIGEYIYPILTSDLNRVCFPCNKRLET